MKVVFLEDGIVEEIDKGEISYKQDFKERVRILINKYGWDGIEVRKIWCFGFEVIGLNLVVDCIKGV